MVSELESRLKHRIDRENWKLNPTARVQYEVEKAHKRRAYRHARALGFSSKEARILSGWSIEKIETLAAERKGGEKSD